MEKSKLIFVVIIVLVLVMLSKNPKAKNSDTVAKTGDNVLQWSDQATEKSRIFGIPYSRIMAMIKVESNGNADSTGSIGEKGLLQVTKQALTDVNIRYKKDFDFDHHLNDPNIQVYIGVAYLKMLKDNAVLYGYVNKESDALDFATRAYNVGASNAVKSENYGKSYLDKVKNAESLY